MRACVCVSTTTSKTTTPTTATKTSDTTTSSWKHGAALPSVLRVQGEVCWCVGEGGGAVYVFHVFKLQVFAGMQQRCATGVMLCVRWQCCSVCACLLRGLVVVVVVVLLLLLLLMLIFFHLIPPLHALLLMLLLCHW